MDVDSYAEMQQAVLGARQQAVIEAKENKYDNQLSNLHVENSIYRASKEKDKEIKQRKQAEKGIAEYNVLLQAMQKRTGMNDMEIKNIKQFAGRVLTAESSGDWTATNNKSSAAGGYQFINTSVKPAVNRMEKILKRDGKKLPKWASDLRSVYSGKVSDDEHRSIITSLDPAQQASLFMADISEKTIADVGGLGDKLLKGVGAGDKKAEALLYLLGHHTSYGDEGVMNNVRRTWTSLTDTDQSEIESFIKDINKKS